MELKHKDLQCLIERAWTLQDSINDETEKISRYSKYCSEHGPGHGHCRGISITGAALQEMESLSAIRDSLKDMENMLMFLQRLRSWQILGRHSALTRLEESRSALIDHVNQYQGRDLDVLNELKSCFGNGRLSLNFSLNKELINKKVHPIPNLTVRHRKRNGIAGLFLCCFEFAIHPRKWQQAAAVAIKLLVVSASVSTAVSFIQSKQRCENSRSRNVTQLVDSKQERRSREILMGRPLDVFHGRG